MNKLGGVKSNWEFVVWYLIAPYISEKNWKFTRTQILRTNFDDVYEILIYLGHKKHPQHTEETIQKTLQNMRDKNWIIFLGQGDYKLTVEGYNEFVNQRKIFATVNNLTKDERALLRKKVVSGI